MPMICTTCNKDIKCRTARHTCPHCKGPFMFVSSSRRRARISARARHRSSPTLPTPPPFRRYDPDDYHEQVSCGSKKCAKSGRKFGFTMYHASALAVKRAKEALRARLETEARARKQSARRAASADARGGGVCGAADELQAFSLGLRDCCPKCWST